MVTANFILLKINCVRLRDYLQRSRRKPKCLTLVVIFSNKANEDIVHLSLIKVNMQNIPSHATDIRHMFRATPQVDELVEVDNVLTISNVDSLETTEGWKSARDIKIDDKLITDSEIVTVKDIQVKDFEYILILG